MDAVWVDGVFAGTISLSIEQPSVGMPVLLHHHHSKEVQLVGYIYDLFSFFLEFPSTLCSSKHQGSCITHFSHKRILIQVFSDFKYLQLLDR